MHESGNYPERERYPEETHAIAEVGSRGVSQCKSILKIKLAGNGEKIGHAR